MLPSLGKRFEPAAGLGTTERCPRMKGQLVAGHVLGPERDHLFERHLEPGQRRRYGGGTPDDQIDGDTSEAPVFHESHRPPGVGRTVPSPQELERLVVKRLHSQAHGVNAEAAPGPRRRLVDILWIGFEKDARVIVKSEPRPDRVQKPFEKIRAERRRCAPSQVDRIEERALRLLDQLQLAFDAFDERLTTRLDSRRNGEVAVRANGGAERNVEIEARTSLGLGLQVNWLQLQSPRPYRARTGRS